MPISSKSTNRSQASLNYQATIFQIKTQVKTTGLFCTVHRMKLFSSIQATSKKKEKKKKQILLSYYKTSIGVTYFKRTAFLSINPITSNSLLLFQFNSNFLAYIEFNPFSFLYQSVNSSRENLQPSQQQHIQCFPEGLAEQRPVKHRRTAQVCQQQS